MAACCGTDGGNNYRAIKGIWVAEKGWVEVETLVMTYSQMKIWQASKIFRDPK